MRLQPALRLGVITIAATLLGLYWSLPTKTDPPVVKDGLLSMCRAKAAPLPPKNEVASIPPLQEPQPTRPSQLQSRQVISPIIDAPLEQFQVWTEDFIAASEEEKTERIAEGVRLAQERRPVFKALIMENPREAIRRAVPMVVRQKLPVEIASLLEKRVNEVGAIRVMQGVPLNLGDPPVPTYREVELQKGGTYRAYVYGERELKLTWTAGAFVNGVAMDSEFAISDEPTRRLEVGEILPVGKPVVGNCPVSGKYVIEPEDVPAEVPETLAAVETPIEIITFCDGSHIAIQNQTILYGEGVTGGSMAFSGILPSSPTPALGQVKVIVLNVTYADQNALPSTEEKLYAVLRDVADHYSKASYGRLSLSGVVAPPIKLPHNEAWYVNRDLSNGGDIGGTNISMADARAEARKLGFDFNDYDCTVMRHNGGPGSYGGLGGGSTVWCRSDTVSLWAHEIGHAFGLGHSNFWDTAGTSSIGNGANDEYGDTYDIMGGAGMAGHYNAQAKSQVRWLPPSFTQQVTESGLYRLHAFDQGSLDSSKRYAMTIVKDTQRTYWGMVRSLFDSNLFAKNGLVFGWRFPNGGGGNFQLIDTTNGSPFAKNDAPISLGATFSDTESGIHLTTVAVSDVPRYVDVQVNLGSFPTNNAPTMTLAASAEVIPLNGSVTFTATANDVDGDPLAYNWQHYGSTAQIVSPNSNVMTRQFTSAGTYIVTCIASDMKGGRVTRNKLITVGTVTTFTIRGRVTLLGQGLSDVVITANNANGVISDADGYFTIPNLPPNTYTLTPQLYGYSFGELFNNSITVGPSFVGADFDATAQSVVTISALNPSANEAAPVTPGTFRLTRTGDLSQDLVVNVNSALGASLKGTDYILTPDYVAGSNGFSTFVIPAESAMLDIAVIPGVDVSSEGPETVILQLGPGNGYVVGSASSATVVIVDDDTALPKISLTATRNSVMENIAAPGLVTISRSGISAADLTVNYTVSGSGSSGMDFTALSGSVTILAGNASATVEITPVDDSTSESLETTILTLSTNAAYIVDPLATMVTVSLYDDDLQTVSVTASDSTATEIDLTLPGAAADTGTFLITRSGDTSAALTVYYAFSGVTGTGVMALHGADYEWMPGVMVIPAGQTSAAITVVPRFDSLGEGTEQCELNLGASATNYILGSSASATVTITDNATDVPYIDVVNSASAAEGSSTSAIFRFSVRSAANNPAIPVQLTASGTADPAGDYQVSASAPQTSGITSSLRGIWVADASNLWAVGDSGRILKGNGATWAAQTSGTTSVLRGIWGSSATSLWAVGDSGVIRSSTDGTAWAGQTSGTTATLRGIWGSSATSLWVVGSSGTIRRSTNGTSWAGQTSGTTNALHAVWGTDASNVWAVGDAGTILKWNGTVWTAQASGTTLNLRGVWGTSATNLWAVGTRPTNGEGVILKGNGSTWTPQTSGVQVDLTGIWGSGAGSVWISGSNGTLLRSLNGTSWSSARLISNNTLFGAVSGANSDNVWAIGDSGSIHEARKVNAAASPFTATLPASASTVDLIFWPEDDADLEDLETINLAINSDAAYQTYAPTSSASAWLRDNENVNTLVVDTQVGTIGAITVAEGATTTPVKFYVSRLGATTAAVTVNITYGGTATGGDDYTAPASVTIPAGALGVNVPVTIINDTLFEGTETITFEFAAGGYSRGPGALMYITDNDSATRTVAFSSISSAAAESVGTVNIPVTLSAAATAPVSVEYLVDSNTVNSSSTISPTTNVTLPYWVRVVKTGTQLSSWLSMDGVSWFQVGVNVTSSNFSTATPLVGLAVGSGTGGQTCTAVLDNVSITGLSPGGSSGAQSDVTVGTTTPASSSSVTSGVHTIAAGGTGVVSGSATDNFRFVYFPVTAAANCTISARVSSISGGGPSSRVGVMVRDGTASNALSYACLVGGDLRTYYTSRSTVGATNAQTIVTPILKPYWLRVERVGNLWRSFISSNGTTFSAMGTTQTIVTGPQVQVGLAVSARQDGLISQATFDNTTLTPTPPGGIAFSRRTVGFVNEIGAYSEAGGVHTLSGSGAGIGTSTVDEGEFAMMTLTGDFVLTTRVTSQAGGANDAQAGLMIRENGDKDSRMIYFGLTTNFGMQSLFRNRTRTTAYGSSVDFTLASGVLNFAVGEQTKNIVLSITNDTTNEPDEVVSVFLRNASGANIGVNSFFNHLILDDDTGPTMPFVGFAAATSTVTESVGTAQIAVALSNPATAACSVDFTTTNGTATEPGDFTSVTGTVTFAAGESVKYISVPITDDAALEGSENLTVTLTNPVGGISGSVSTHTLSLTDNDLPVITLIATDPTAGEAGLDEGEFTFYRTGDTSAELTVNYAVSGTASSATDRQGVSTSVTFLAGFDFARRLVIPLDDVVSEATETTILTLSVNAAYTVGTPSTATVNILDDDRSTVTITANDPLATEAAGNPGQFTITRTAPTNVALTVNVTVAGTATNTTDYGNVPSTVVFAIGDVSKTINILPVDDGNTEGPEDVTISLGSGSYDIGASSYGNVSIVDNDIPPTVFIASPSVQTPLIATTNGVILSAQVSDDGTPAALTSVWSCVSGPGVATIESPNATTTAVSFSVPGTYVLRLSATDGQFTVSDQTTVFVGNAVTAGNWLTQDLGPSSSRRGQGLEYGGLFSVTGTGAGYAATPNDQAHVMLHDIIGDGSVIARITNFSTAAALAGVTIRDSLGRGSSRAVLGVVPGTGLQFRTRATGGNDTVVTAAAPALPCWLKLDRNATTSEISASYSTDGTAWTALGTPVTIPLLNSTAYYGLTATSNSTTSSATALFDNVSLTPVPTGPALYNEDNGLSLNPAGSGSFDGTTYTISGGTNGYFHGWQYNGDLDIRCRLATFSSGAGSSSGGLRITESIEGGAYVHYGRKPTDVFNGYYWVGIANGSNNGVPGGVIAGTWIRLVRRGNNVTAYRATHNSGTGGPNAWTQVGQPQTIIMTSPLWVGFYVDNASGVGLNTATFTNLTVTALNKAPVIAATAGAVSPLSLDGTITDDDLPAAPTSLWSKRSGPAGLVFGNATLPDTTATLTESGAYVLRLTADDTGTKSFFDLNLTAYTTPFAQWLDVTGTGNENNLIAEEGLDPDQDGLVNLLEYALGTNGTIAGGNPYTVMLAPFSEQQYLRLTLPKNATATDVQYIVEACGDLSDWSTVGLVTEVDDATQLVVRDSVPAGPGVRRFMRVRVTRP